MKELELKYGCNPNQKPSKIFMRQGELPIEVLNGKVQPSPTAQIFVNKPLLRQLSHHLLL